MYQHVKSQHSPIISQSPRLCDPCDILFDAHFKLQVKERYEHEFDNGLDFWRDGEGTYCGWGGRKGSKRVLVVLFIV